MTTPIVKLKLNTLNFRPWTQMDKCKTQDIRGRRQWRESTTTLVTSPSEISNSISSLRGPEESIRLKKPLHIQRGKGQGELKETLLPLICADEGHMLGEKRCTAKSELWDRHGPANNMFFFPLHSTWALREFGLLHQIRALSQWLVCLHCICHDSWLDKQAANYDRNLCWTTENGRRACLGKYPCAGSEWPLSDALLLLPGSLQRSITIQWKKGQEIFALQQHK